MMFRLVAAMTLAGFLAGDARAEVRKITGASALKQQLERLRVVGSVMMIAAHPDDENTALLAYCAQGRKLRTAYLSLTRGEGGQNLIGSEQGDLLGVIRTQELLAARRVDGAEQYFTRAIDFGFSKTADETLAKWGREKVLSDVVWVIRRYRPDVIFLRFSGTTRDGHGHHQASTIIAKEAFKLAADASAFPEQLKYVQPWQAKRLLWNGFSFTRQQEQELEKTPGRLMVDTGEYDPVLGLSYGELAGISRSQHRSQGMGSPERRGSVPNYLFDYGGEPAKSDFMDGVDTTWNRLPGGALVQKALDEAASACMVDEPEKVIAPLLRARKLIVALIQANHVAEAHRKLEELDEAVAMAAGLWLEVSAGKAEATPGSTLPLTMSVLNRGRAKVELTAVTVEGIKGAPSFPGAALKYNVPATAQASFQIPDDQPASQPLWLREPKQGNLYTIPNQLDIGPAEGPPALQARFRLTVEGEPVEVVRPVENRYVDRVRGELTRPLVVVPPVSLQLADTALLFPDAKPRTVTVEVRANSAGTAGEVLLKAPHGWKVEPLRTGFDIAEAEQVSAASFTVTPPQADANGDLRVVARTGRSEVSTRTVELNYEHIPPQVISQPARTRMIREEVQTLAKHIGYVMGAGDAVPEALKQLGGEVTLLDSSDLARGDLSRFDAIVTGVRAWNVRPDLRAAHERLRQYMEDGGTLVVQYNTLDGFASTSSSALSNIGPYPLKIGRGRTTVEEAPVRFLKPDHRLLQMPNRITSADFDGWIQERALYFASEWDSHYEALLETNDPGEPAEAGGLLYAKVGKGAYVFTSYAWFRQLPAGVPGAYRLFANLISAGK